MRSVSVVVAAYDERENVEPLVQRLRTALDGLADWRWELIFVVEGTDGTHAILQRLSAGTAGLQVLYREQPSGIGAAFRRGFAAVAPSADYVVTLDADLNHQPEEIPRLLAAAVDRQCDLLVGSRFVLGASASGTPLWKKVLSTSINHLMRRLFRLEVLDNTSGFRVYRAAALRALRFDNDEFAFLPELLVHAHAAGMRIEEEPIQFVFRRAGASKLRLWHTSLSYLSLLRPRWRRRPLPTVDDRGAA